MESAADANEARRLVNDIRRDLTISKKLFGSRLESLVSSCLEVLSAQLYARSTHFLLELIQNADDNKYECQRPALSFSYKPGSLRIDCNEVGFTPDNVEALCSVDKSTKSGKGHDGEHIGEKGIGFKSVFKAADVVWVSSRDFSFKFDKSQPLGMISPIWAPFPEPTKPGCTSIFLQLADSFDQDNLSRELVNFDINILIFLRKIEEINIRVLQRDQQTYERDICKVQNLEGDDAVVELHTEGPHYLYIIRTHVITDLPSDEKRSDWLQTKVLLAFPTVTKYEVPRPLPQNVYAFLPIRNYGLKFLVQGDFLLTASREDIESTLPWNHRLRDGVAEAFLLSIDQFNKGDLKYLWPYYLPSTSTAAGTFFESAVDSILQKLQDKEVLESCAGTMVKPHSLWRVPSDQFADEDGKPFTLNSQTASTYLSWRYPAWAVNAIYAVGVSELSPSQFLEDLKLTIDGDGTAFHNKPAEWHSQLATTLVKLGTNPELMSMIRDISIVPLHDGTWTSAKGQSMFFSDVKTSLEVPSGIEIMVVDPDAGSDPNRRMLLANLGVKSWDAPEICQLVLETHSSSSFDPKTLNKDQLISHAAFLWKSKWQPPKQANLWFATMQDERCLGRELYIPGGGDPSSATSNIFAKLQTKFAVIHEDYIKAFESDPHWPRWLVNNLGLSMVPRLVSPHVNPEPQPAQSSCTGAAQSSFTGAAKTAAAAQTQDIEQRLSKIERALLSINQIALDLVNPFRPDLRQKLPQLPLSAVEDLLRESQERYNSQSQEGMPRPNLQNMMSGTGSMAGRNQGMNPSKAHLPPRNADTNKQQSARRKGFQSEKDFEMQLMLLEQQNKKRLTARQEKYSLDASSPVSAPLRAIDIFGSLPNNSPGGSDNLFNENISDNAFLNTEVTDAGFNFFDGVLPTTQPPSSSRLSTPPQAQAPLEDLAGARINGNVDIDQQCGVPPANGSSFDLLLAIQQQRDLIVRPPRTRRELEQRPNSPKSSGEIVLNKSDYLDPNFLASITKAAIIFELSEEFSFLFRECRTADVLQLLRDNWQHYSQWIDGAHLSWQSAEFVQSCTQLKCRLKECLVETGQGPVELQMTVLAGVDSELDRSGLTPSVDVRAPLDPEWKLLAHFGVIMKTDSAYYLRCLEAIAKNSCGDIDMVEYIYEKVQERYKGSEGPIRDAFQNMEIILARKRSQGRLGNPCWTSMTECEMMGIDLKTEYPRSSYLFRCLESTIGDPIAAKVKAAASITISTSLKNISLLLCDLSAALEDVPAAKAAELLRPLQDLAVFPVCSASQSNDGGEYDEILASKDSSWYIADKPRLRQSFLRVVPLLALSINDLAKMKNLLQVLRLKERTLSTIVTMKTTPKGRISAHWALTSFLRARVPFIQALVPESCPNRQGLLRQIEGVRVNVATIIDETFSMRRGNEHVQGKCTRGQALLSTDSHFLILVVADECAATKTLPHELIDLVATTYEIKDPAHFSLLHATLTRESLENISSTFSMHGLDVQGVVFDKSKARYIASMGIPSPFWGGLQMRKEVSSSRLSALQFAMNGRVLDTRSRRIPMKGAQASQPGPTLQVQHVSEEFTRWHQIEYLGQHMVSKLLQAYLGQGFSPERDWTHNLRRLSGHSPFMGSGPCAEFTLRDAGIVAPMTKFLVEYGTSRTVNWKKRLLENPPVYHIHLAVSLGGKSSSFKIGSSAVEQAKRYRMSSNASETSRDVVVMVRVTDLYSQEQLSFDFFVDPWYLIESNELALEYGWFMPGRLRENEPGQLRKRQRRYQPSISWAAAGQSAAFTPRHRAQEPYTHKPLRIGEIRLLHLLPGRGSNALQGAIVHTERRLADPYRALSYVWGSDQRTKQLVTPDGVVWITLSLENALRHLRQADEPTLLWVDAICINQGSTSEKAQQIRFMAEIFQSAELTYAFLGNCGGSDKAIQMLMQVRAKALREKASRQEQGFNTEDSDDDEVAGPSCEWPSGLPDVPRSWRNKPMPPLEDPVWNSVERIFSSPFFRRAWIIQEMVASLRVSVVCGKWIVDWTDLHFAMDIIDREIEMSASGGDHHRQKRLRSSWEPFLTLAVQREWEARKYRWALLMLLEHFRHVESTLSRDRLFALVGLASDANEPEFEPNYNEPFPAIVLRFAQAFVRQGRGMHLLYCAGLESAEESPTTTTMTTTKTTKTTGQFPSWIPDWTKIRPKTLSESEAERHIPFWASGDEQQDEMKCVPDTDELLVRGYLVDTVASVSKWSNVSEEWGAYFKEVDEMVDSCPLLSPVSDSRADLKWKVPITCMEPLDLTVSSDINLGASYRAFRQGLAAKGPQEGGGDDDDDDLVEERRSTAVVGAVEGYRAALGQMLSGAILGRAAPYKAALQGTLSGWRFVATKKGRVGVAPRLVRPGDEVVIFKGGQVPFILRKSLGDRPEALWRLVGECYVHSIMNGEGIQGSGATKEWFRLH